MRAERTWTGVPWSEQRSCERACSSLKLLQCKMAFIKRQMREHTCSGAQTLKGKE